MFRSRVSAALQSITQLWVEAVSKISSDADWSYHYKMRASCQHFA